MPAAPAAAAKRVIVADDTSFVRDRFRAALQSAGHSTWEAADAGELLARVRGDSGNIDLVVLDLRLPRAQGPGIVRALRAIEGFRAPIVVFSGTIAHATEVRELLHLGVAGYVSEYSAAQHIAPALAPHLFPERHNRRASARVAVAVPVTMRQGGTITSAVTLNIGSGGLAVRTANPPDRGTALKVRFRLPDTGREIAVDSTVAWTDRRIGMGLQFTSLAPDDQSVTDDFVRSRFFRNRKA